MYTTTVKVRKILGGREALKMYAPIFIWLIAEFIAFLIGVKVEPLALFLMFIIFFTIIPIVYCGRKKWILWSEKSIINKEVTFNAVNGELYVENKKMNVAYNETETEIYVDDFVTYEGKYGVKTIGATFVGYIEEPYLQDFIKFLNEQGIEIDKLTPYSRAL